MIGLCGGLITEALCSGTSNSKNPVLQSIAITQYGDYEIKAPEGVDGYNPIHVNLKDRYQAGYTDGWMKCFLNIKTITITKNGTYNAKSENLEGYNPVVVDVPDRYDEGYNDGYKDGYEDGYKKGLEDGKGSIDLSNIDCSFSTSVSTIVDYGVTADTYFRIDMVVHSNGGKQAQLVLINKTTGETKVMSSTVILIGGTNKVVWKIDSISLTGNPKSSVSVTVIPYVNGEPKGQYAKKMTGSAKSVGGTCLATDASPNITITEMPESN